MLCAAGKTTTLVELVVQCVARGEKVLACAPSNIAVDNLVERIVQASAHNASHQPKHSSTSVPSAPSASPFHAFRCIRVGHPARLSPAVLAHSLDSVVKTSDGGSITRDIEAEIAQTQTDINKSRDRAEKKALRGQWKLLQKELRVRQKKAVKDTLAAASVLCCTLIGAASSSLAGMAFDTVIIDECAQAIEAACLIPLLLCRRRLVLAGDHRQLGPVIKAKEGAAELAVTLMNRVNRRSDSAAVTEMLVEQYRMNEDIMRWSSDEFYNSRLTAPDDVRRRRLTELPHVTADTITEAPLVFIDTAGCEMYEDERESEAGGAGDTKSEVFKLLAQSSSNQHEVALVHRHIARLLACRVALSAITVLSPYLAQVSALRDRLLPDYPQLEIGTIDSMQGRENDCVLISCVRSSEAGGRRGVGFLSDERRLNVAVTRGRRQVCVVADSETLSQNAFLKRLVHYLTNNERVEYISASEYQDQPISAEEAKRAAVLAPVVTDAQPVAAKPTKPLADAKPQPRTSAAAVEVEKPSAAAAAASSEVWDRLRIESLCREVLSGQKQHFAFPSSLTSDDRRLVHEVADEVGGGRLQHDSEGHGHKRRIALRLASAPATSFPATKTSAAVKAGSAIASQPSSKEEQRAAALARMEAAAKPKQAAAKAVNEQKADKPPVSQPAVTAAQAAALLMDGGEASDDEHDAGPSEQPSEEKAPPTAQPTTKRGKKASKAALPSAVSAVEQPPDDADLDGFLDSLAKGVSICASPTCSARCVSMGAVCRFCNLRFCMAHANSILHGCASEAKEDALRRDMERHQAREQGRRVGGLKDGDRRLLSERLAKKADAARKEGEVESRKEKEKKKKEGNKR